MKKWFSNHKTIFLSCLIGISFIIVVILGVVIAPGKKKEDAVMKNGYQFSKEVQELDGTHEYSNESLQSKHCLDNICISEAKFYYLSDQGRVDYTIENLNTEAKSGLFKMVFGDSSLVVSFTNLEPGKALKTTSQYIGQTINNMSDYSLEYLTDEEKASVRVSNY